MRHGFRASPTPRPSPGVPTTNFYRALCDDDATGTPDIIIDTGAEENFADVNTPGTHRRATLPGQQITMLAATGDSCTSIATDTFQLPLPAACLDYHVFLRGKVRHPLLSVSKACDAGMTVVFNADECRFLKNGTTHLRAPRRGGLWTTPSVQRPALAMNAPLTTPYRKRATDPATLPNLLCYLHACAGFPVPSTWIQAIWAGYFLTWPGLSPARVRQYLPKSDETVLGHMKLIRQSAQYHFQG